MFPIPDALAAFYLTCFAVGFLFVLVSLLLGVGHDTLHLPGMPHGDAGGGDTGVVGHDLASHDPAALVGLDGGFGHGASPANGGEGSHTAGGPNGTTTGHHTENHGVSPFNLMTIMAFLTWFGGAGYVLRVYTGLLEILSLVGAILVGLAGGAIVFYLLARVFIPNQRFLDPADYRMEGTVARVTVPIHPGLVGEIVYTMAGTQRSDGARSIEGKTIDRGTEVVVVSYDKGIAYVEPWSSFVEKG